MSLSSGFYFFLVALLLVNALAYILRLHALIFVQRPESLFSLFFRFGSWGRILTGDESGLDEDAKAEFRALRRRSLLSLVALFLVFFALEVIKSFR